MQRFIRNENIKQNFGIDQRFPTLLLVTLVFTILSNFSSFAQSVVPVNLNSKPYDYDVYVIVDEMPEFPGGEKGLRSYFKSNSKFPISQKKDHKNTVYFSIVIAEDGTILHPKILLGISDKLDDNTLKLIEGMPKWKPGYKNGKKVKVSLNLSITYE